MVTPTPKNKTIFRIKCTKQYSEEKLNNMCKFFKLLLLFYVILSHQMDTFRFILILSSLSSVTYNVLDDNFIFYSKMYLYNNEILILLNKLPNDK